MQPFLLPPFFYPPDHYDTATILTSVSDEKNVWTSTLHIYMPPMILVSYSNLRFIFACAIVKISTLIMLDMPV